jgi:hypothetical protein
MPTTPKFCNISKNMGVMKFSSKSIPNNLDIPKAISEYQEITIDLKTKSNPKLKSTKGSLQVVQRLHWQFARHISNDHFFLVTPAKFVANPSTAFQNQTSF